MVRGLSAGEAAARLARDGPNTLPVPPAVPAWHRFAAQLAHFFALMLWVAGALAVVAGLPQLGIAIFAVIVINGAFASAQENRAERAALRLRDLLPRRATVVRDGLAVDVDARDLVAGDTVLLAPGDRICADLRLTATSALRLDLSTLTGESETVAPEAGATAYAGTFVVEGEATAVVTATGARTRLAAIAALTRSGRRPPTPLARELHRVVRTVALVAVAVGVGFFGLALLLGTPARDGFLFAIGVTVALVPEGLLPTVTLSLAIGAQRMADRNALVRHLEAVETLGSTTFICTDKTGTLTENRMAVVAVWTPAGRARITGRGYDPEAEVHYEDPLAAAAIRSLAAAGARCSTGRAVPGTDGWEARGDPMEAALDALAHRLAAPPPAAPERARFPFDPRRRRMAVVIGDRVLVKGAPDAVLPRCAPVTGAEDELAAMTARGLRVLAVASRAAPGAVPATADEAEVGLELLGLVGLEDPPRPHAAAAIAACRAAGMNVAMITGDHPATAAAIAREIGLLTEGAPVLEGRALPADDAELGALVDRDGAVIARVEPEQKLRIARALRARGHVVAMTGDGVNDGPALSEADIGIAMGRSGTDVAREAADLVLLDDDFATIVAAVEQGRATFANLRRFLTYHLTDNVAELAPFVVWALSGGTFPLAIGVLQVLALDIGTDTLPAVALGADPPGPRTLATPPARGRLLDRIVARRAFAVLGPTEAVVSLLAFLATFVAAGWRPGAPFPSGGVQAAASGAAFAAIVLGQAANTLACRSRSEPVWRIPVRTNRLLIPAVATELAVLVALLAVPALADLLDQAGPTLVGGLVALGAPAAVLLADAADKARRRP